MRGTARRYRAITQTRIFVRGSSLWTTDLPGKILAQRDVLQHRRAPLSAAASSRLLEAASTVYTAGSIGTPRRFSSHGASASSAGRRARRTPAPPPGQNTSAGVPCISTCGALFMHQHAGPRSDAISSMLWLTRMIVHAAHCGDSPGCWPTGSRGRAGQVPPSARPESAHPAPSQSRLRCATRRFCPPERSNGDFSSCCVRDADQSGGLPRRVRPISSSGQAHDSSGRKQCPYRRSPQRADTPDTGTPAPP